MALLAALYMTKGGAAAFATQTSLAKSLAWGGVPKALCPLSFTVP